MNLLANEHELDRQQERAIYELTLKKQRSKKSTISQRQVAAMQQLASELVTQRKDFDELIILGPNRNNLVRRSDSQVSCDASQLCRCNEFSLALAAAAAVTAAATDGSAEHTQLDCRFTPEATKLYAGERAACRRESTIKRTKKAPGQQDTAGAGNQLQRQSSTSTIATNSTLTSSSNSSEAHSSSSSVASLSSSDLSVAQLVHLELDSRLSRASESRTKSTPSAEKKTPKSSPSFLSTTSTTSLCMSEETNIRLKRLRLEQLNNELESRLHQYEYLVAQEKAILGAHKMNLFTNEGVNNFHLFRPDQKSPYKS